MLVLVKHARAQLPLNHEIHSMLKTDVVRDPNNETRAKATGKKPDPWRSAKNHKIDRSREGKTARGKAHNPTQVFLRFGHPARLGICAPCIASGWIMPGGPCGRG